MAQNSANGRKFLKKILSLFLLACALYGEAKIYVGTGVGLLSEKFDDANYKSKTYNHAKFKVGYGDRDAYAVEFSFDYTQKDAKSNIYNETDTYGLSIELLKAFNLDLFANPYLKAGYGFGYCQTKGAQSQTLRHGHFTLGTGVFIPLNEYLDLQLGYEYKNISYERYDQTTTDTKIKSHANVGYAGINVRF
jgi:opacity protein-like surface antigen